MISLRFLQKHHQSYSIENTIHKDSFQLISIVLCLFGSTPEIAQTLNFLLFFNYL